jgi:ATP-dependent exoDNAse (exonuclease V) beta subunit
MSEATGGPVRIVAPEQGEVRTTEAVLADPSPRPPLTPEQRAAVLGRQSLLALSAGAGSGKTTVLVERFLSLVREGVSPLEILAVTFTEKAAAEMKERLIARFHREGDEVNRRRAEAAYVSTIHSLCARLLRENPFAARLDPSFGVMDALTRGLFLDDWLRRLYQDPWFRANVDGFPAVWRSDEPLLWTLIRDAALRPREFATEESVEAGYDVEGHVAAAMARLDAEVEGRWGEARAHLLALAPVIRGMTVGGPASRAKHQRICELLESLTADAVLDGAWAAEFCGVTDFTRGAGKDPAIGVVRATLPDVRKEIKALAEVDRDVQEALERERIAPLKVGIHERARALREAYDAHKRQQNLLDFEDLQQRALALLDEPSVRAEYAGRFRHLLLDEAQDTNPVQMRLVERLLDGRNHLFAVGDVKQAIYGFRGASVALFQALCASAGEGRMSLTENFRSRPEIIDLVNAAGERLWDEGELVFEPLAARFPYPPAGDAPHVELHLYRKLDDGEGETEDAERLRLREGADLARWIREAVEGPDPLRVYDRGEGRMRPARYRDVAILTRTRTPVPAYAHALARAGVPFVQNGGRGFFAGLEITDVLGALRVVLNPSDEPSLLAVLRSPLFGWSDADLVRLRTEAGKGWLWGALARGFRPEAPGAFAEAYELLSELRALRADLPPGRLIEHLMERTRYRAALLQTSRGRAQVANLGKLVEFARSYAAEGGTDLRGFVARAALAERHLGDEGDAPLAAEGDDVVSLTTMHGAKGLEWPIVILPSLGGDLVQSRGASCYSAPDGSLLVEPLDEQGDAVRPMSNAPVRRAIQRREEAEARRLFYVALTRAREYLVLSGEATYPEKPAERFARPVDWLCRQLGIDEHGSGETTLRLGAAELRVVFAEPGGEAATAESELERRLRAARRLVRERKPVEWDGPVAAAEAGRILERLRERESGPAPAPLPASTVTRLTYFHRCPRVYYYDLVLQVEEHQRGRERDREAGRDRELTAMELGSRVHSLLERADFHASPAAEARRLAASEETLGEHERARVERMLANVLADPLMERVRRAVRVEREYPFYLEVNGTVLQGVIDLLFVEADGRAVVVDYKSNDLAAPGRLDALTEYYRSQVELYALAVQQAGLGIPSEAILYFLNRPVGRVHPVGPERLATVAAETAVVLERIAAGDWDTEPGEKCRSCGYRARGFCEIGRRWTE